MGGIHMWASKVVVGLAAGLLALGGASASAGGKHDEPKSSVTGLKVLIVNDDSIQGKSANGSDGKGLYELRKAMCAAGADVIVVGPWTVQSGMGGRITLSGNFVVQPVTPPAAYTNDCSNAPSGGNVFGLCTVPSSSTATTCDTTSASGSPSDAVNIALSRFIPDNYWPQGPDIVLSGINYGQNEAVGVFHSGTTSAAVTANQLHAPSIAFSAKLGDTQEQLYACALSTDLTQCPAFEATAKFAVDLVGKLRAARMIDSNLLLNVNYPFLSAGEQVGKPVINVLGYGSTLGGTFGGSVTTAGGAYTFAFNMGVPETRRNADTTALMNNDISIVPLSGDWTDSHVDIRLRAVVSSLR
ncbi:MAG: 5'/3'-nucleotidase SurE [Ilumatobacteraceae bacterium]